MENMLQGGWPGRGHPARPSGRVSHLTPAFHPGPPESVTILQNIDVKKCLLKEGKFLSTMVWGKLLFSASESRL